MKEGRGVEKKLGDAARELFKYKRRLGFRRRAKLWPMNCM